MNEELLESIDEAARAISRVANAITPTSALVSPDETGAYVSSLTEAAMGITAGLCRIAESIETLAGSVDRMFRK